MSSLNLAIITNFKGNLQIAEGNGHYYIVWVYPDGYFEPEREITREVLWMVAYMLDAPLERLDFKTFDLRPESDWELEQEQERLAAEEKSEQHAQADQVPARVWFAELKAKYHSKEGIKKLAREHANDPMPNCVFRECANVPRIRSTDDANGNWVLNINGCELYVRSHTWGNNDTHDNHTSITIGNTQGGRDPVEPKLESQFAFMDGKLCYHHKLEDTVEDL